MNKSWVLVAALVVGSGCGKSEAKKSDPPKAVVDKTPPVAVPVPVPAGKLAWIEDDYPKALAAAKARQIPIMIDLWAPWCHTCLSMKSYVLNDANMAAYADKVIWLSINTEKAENAAVMAKFGLDAWPTYYLVDSADESVAGRWVGSTSAAEFQRFIDDGRRAAELAHAGPIAPGDPVGLLLSGHRALAAKKYKEAATFYDQTLSASAPEWPRRAETLVALLYALSAEKEWTTCLARGVAGLSQVGNGTSGADFSSSLLGCADELPPKDPQVVAARQAAIGKLRDIAEDPQAPIAADDRSAAYATLREELEKDGDKAGARAMAEKQILVLEKASNGVPDDVAMAFDWARADAYLYVGREGDAIAFLTKREAALPTEYNPPNYLARVYSRLGRLDEAVAAVDRAIAKSYGPRKTTLLGFKADVLEKQNKIPEAAAVVEEELTLYKALPEGQQIPERLAEIAQRNGRLHGASGGPEDGTHGKRPAPKR